MMKLKVLIGLVLFPMVQLFAQDFEIAVHSKKQLANGKIYLEYLNPKAGRQKIDSTLLDANNNGVFKGKVLDNGGFYYISFFNVEKPQRVLLILEGGEKVKVEADGERTEDNGGKYLITAENSFNIPMMNQLVSISESMNETVKKLNAKFQADQTKGPEIEKEFKAIQDKTIAKIRELIPQMGTHLVALYATNFLDFSENLDLMKQIAANLQKERASHPLVQSFVQSIQAMDQVAVGSQAPEISQATPSGEIFTLSSLKGKLVMLDFWASWCGPCRKENPNVVRIYQKFKDKGFEILGISLDEKKEAWLNAIEKDGLIWKHVSDLGFWNNQVAVKYGVKFIPQTFMVDPSGKIIAKDLRGPALEQFLEKYYSTN